MKTSKEIYADMHKHRSDFSDERLRVWDRLSEADALIFRLVSANAEILSLVQEKARRHSIGSPSRVALDELALEITEKLETLS